MRVVGSSGIVYRPYDPIYVRTIPMSGFMDRRSRYSVPKTTVGLDNSIIILNEIVS